MTVSSPGGTPDQSTCRGRRLAPGGALAHWMSWRSLPNATIGGAAEATRETMSVTMTWNRGLVITIRPIETPRPGVTRTTMRTTAGAAVTARRRRLGSGRTLATASAAGTAATPTTTLSSTRCWNGKPEVGGGRGGRRKGRGGREREI